MANLHWLEPTNKEAFSHGITFGMPWARGLYQPDQAFELCATKFSYPLDSREIAFWPDGSLKWTSHSISGNIDYCDKYTVKGIDLSSTSRLPSSEKNGKLVTRAGTELELGSPGSSMLFKSLSWNNNLVCSGATILASIKKEEYSTLVKTVHIENESISRILLKVSGVTVHDKKEHLPFDLRIYIYQETGTISIFHSFIHDLDPDESLTSLGLRFSVPLKGTELFNRHIRFVNGDGGVLAEEVQGLSGLRYGPSLQNRIDQTAGKPVVLKEDEWEKTSLSKGRSYVPSWSSYSLSQLTPFGFNLKKSTKSTCSSVPITSGTHSSGIFYLGSANSGGLAIGMSNFWERYPTQLDLDDLTTDEGKMTVWLYSPLAEPLDTRPYHDGLGMNTYEQQLEGLNVTYEDYEPRFSTANGIGRSNNFYITPFLSTPSKATLSAFASRVRSPPRLLPTLPYLHSTLVFAPMFSPSPTLFMPSQPIHPREEKITHNLSTLHEFYTSQVRTQSWYGFFSHGDFMHAYDPLRHTWKYDIGGYAWDNSELGTDLWLWLYYLYSGKASAFKLAKSMTEHTSEVDVYHSGRFKGFGTRHGVQHWGDSAKQLRVSSVLFRKFWFFLSGGEERMGDLIGELSDCQTALAGLDAHRKVQAPPDLDAEGVDIPLQERGDWAMANIGLDLAAVVAAWMSVWERRGDGWREKRAMIARLVRGIVELEYGIANNAVLLNVKTGEVRACPAPTPKWAISHLSMLFGFLQVFGELRVLMKGSGKGGRNDDEKNNVEKNNDEKNNDEKNNDEKKNDGEEEKANRHIPRAEDNLGEKEKRHEHIPEVEDNRRILQASDLFWQKAFLPYARAYNGSKEAQLKEFGFEFPDHATWHQSHSTLTAMVAVEEGSEKMGKEAWRQFFETDGYTEIQELKVVRGEAEWVSTNESAQYGICGVFNLANIRGYL